MEREHVGGNANGNPGEGSAEIRPGNRMVISSNPVRRLPHLRTARSEPCPRCFRISASPGLGVWVGLRNPGASRHQSRSNDRSTLRVVSLQSRSIGKAWPASWTNLESIGTSGDSANFSAIRRKLLSISSIHLRHWPRSMFIETETGESSCHNTCSYYTVTAKPGRS
jgi:hypothetical protein